MFKKIELWIVILLFVIFLISTILYGSLLRYHYKGGQKFLAIQKVAVFFAGIPSNFKKIVITGHIDTPDLLTKHKDKPRFKRFISSNREVLLVLPRYDGNLMRSVVEIIDLNTFEVLHTYKHDIASMNNLIDMTNEEHRRLKLDDSEIRFEYRHPLILEDGSLISDSDYAPLFKIDFCSNLLWINQEERFHHSKMLDNDGNIWVGSVMFPYSKFVGGNRKKIGFVDDAITKINKEGKIIFKKSISELLYNKKYLSISEIFIKYDPIHLNDIEPAISDTQYWKKGDLFISIKNQSAVIHYRPSTNKVINYMQGPFYQQHDVDLISDKEVSIFNNNNSVSENSRYSEVLIYNFETKTLSKKFNRQLKENNFKTKTQGLADFLKDGSMLVEEQNHVRLIFFNKDGEKEWEFVNKDDNGNINFFSWSRVVEDINLIDKLNEKIENARCSN